MPAVSRPEDRMRKRGSCRKSCGCAAAPKIKSAACTSFTPIIIFRLCDGINNTLFQDSFSAASSTGRLPCNLSCSHRHYKADRVSKQKRTNALIWWEQDFNEASKAVMVNQSQDVARTEAHSMWEEGSRHSEGSVDQAQSAISIG